MPPRNANRRKSKNVSGKGKGQVVAPAVDRPGLPSETLHAVLSELNLSYDSSLGLLQGDSMFSAPSEPKLTALKKLLERFISDLETGIETDRRLVASIDAETNTADGQDAAEGKPVAEEAANGAAEEGVKVKMEDDEDDDEGGIQFPKRKRRRIIITANGERKEITPDARDDDDDDSVGNGVDADDAIDDEDTPLGALDVKQERQVLKISSEKKSDLDTADTNGDAIPSVYVGKEKTQFDVKELLKSAYENLELFDEEQAHEKYGDGEEFLKHKYAVAEFPHNDMKDYLPGEIPMTDFSTAKPNNNQIAFTSFQAYVDPFFRPFTEEDSRLLRTKCNLSSNLPRDYDDKKTPYRIPRLGPHYADVWYEEDLRNGLVKDSNGMGFSLRKHLEMSMLSLVEPKLSSDSLTNETLETEDVSCGPLTSRLLSALIKDTTDEDGQDDDLAGSPVANEENGSTESANGDGLSSSALADQQGWKSSIIKTDYKTLDERLKRELRYIGVYMNVEQMLNEPGFDQDWVQNREDDEIARELRHLQKELKEVQARNIKRKKMIIPIVEEQIAWQEYMSILEDLDKQVEQHYRRRISVGPKKAKKRGIHPGGNGPKEKDEYSNQQIMSNSSFMSLLEKRNKWISRIGPLFKSQRDMRRMPEESIFKDVNLAENEEEEEGEDIAEDDVLDQMELE
ncbi:hypothetical protein OGAPHI_000920 [Ogataea philodendri]|uniref:Uncharacterized protein n=2 Tax=Saccharomycotina TaxID=147537 RepID=A0A9P8PF49_9ASCO|nr:uncharacterized protein OGAPHI_000920 [Ogataea philodendri]KAH3670405.1 hypothetical protein OGAPHI_000920 [Ogataea philodendri]